MPLTLSFERQFFFWSRVERQGDHLIWTGSKTDRGYGKIEVNGEVVYAHRVAWCLAQCIKLHDMEDLIILRTCERNDCIEPTHLTSRKKRKKPSKKA